ncbi:MAG: hypothetical protein EB015_03405 [Methylocystaceae bacterium]|nr:hypothetical protein [Methylocystaceae bacterium]
MYEPRQQSRVNFEYQDWTDHQGSLGQGLAYLVTFGLLTLIFVSPMVLFHWGVHYEDSVGSFFEKIHPATWILLLAWMFSCIVRGNPFLLFEDIATHYSFVFYFIGVSFLCLFAVFIKKGSITPLIDTFVLPLVVASLFAMASEQQKKFWSLLFHIAFNLNALLGLYEFLTGYRLTPYVAGIVLIESDWRSTAFLGHPLSNATMTGCYILIMALGGGKDLPHLIRLAILLVQGLGMVAFGGRAALVLAIAILLVLVGQYCLQILHGKKINPLYVTFMIKLIPLFVMVFLYGIEHGFFDRLTGRFVNDEGSAKARLIMFELFNYITWSDLLMGPDGDLISTLQNNQGIEFGIESFWIGFILNYGLICSLLFFSALFTFSWKIVDLTQSGSGVIIFYFFALASTSVSLSAKDILLGILVAMLMSLMRIESNPFSNVTSPMRVA